MLIRRSAIFLWMLNALLSTISINGECCNTDEFDSFDSDYFFCVKDDIIPWSYWVELSSEEEEELKKNKEMLKDLQEIMENPEKVIKKVLSEYSSASCSAESEGEEQKDTHSDKSQPKKKLKGLGFGRSHSADVVNRNALNSWNGKNSRSQTFSDSYSFMSNEYVISGQIQNNKTDCYSRKNHFVKEGLSKWDDLLSKDQETIELLLSEMVLEINEENQYIHSRTVRLPDGRVIGFPVGSIAFSDLCFLHLARSAITELWTGEARVVGSGRFYHNIVLKNKHNVYLMVDDCSFIEAQQ